MKRSISFLLLLALGTVIVVFNSCGKDDDPTSDKGVVINGVKWATRNVAAPGFFASKPEDVGMFYQWNRKKAWAANGDTTDWDATIPEGYVWQTSNDPSPAGWRVPYEVEIPKLLDADKVNNEWTTRDGINGRKFTDKITGNSIFLPAAGYRHSYDGTFINDGDSYFYWSSTVPEVYYSVGAYCLRFGSRDSADYISIFRAYGFSVRSVEY